MPVSTECAAALLSFRYPSILVNEYLNLAGKSCSFWHFDHLLVSIIIILIISRKVVFGPFDHLWVDIKKATKDQFLRTAWYATIKKFLPGFNQTKMFYDQVRTFLHFRRSLFFPFSFFLWSFVYENKKQRKINFSETLDRPCTIKEPLGDSWYQVLRNKKVLDGVGAFIQLRWSLLFSFSFYFWNFFCKNKLKSNERSIFQNRLICHDILLSLSRGFTKHKGLHQGACLPPTLVISAFS